MLTELRYRTFDELFDSVAGDLKTYALEGMMDPQPYIKVAQRVSYELGLKVNPARGKLLEVDGYKARLPEDFHVLNFALACGPGRRGSCAGEGDFLDGLLRGMALSGASDRLNQFTVTLDLPPGETRIPHTLGTRHVVVQALAPEGTLLSYRLHTPSDCEVVIHSEAEETVEGVRVNMVGTAGGGPVPAGLIAPRCELRLDAEGQAYLRHHHLRRGPVDYARLVPLQIERGASVSDDCLWMDRDGAPRASLRGGFLHTAFERGEVYLNYQSLMEDDQGNLLVLDHPLVNDYYEYALKERLLENLLLSGEPVQNQYALVVPRLRMARAAAIGFTSTPDYSEMKRVWLANRRAQHHNYYNMFKSR